MKHYERNADFILSEALSNFLNVKYYGADKTEIERYTKTLDVFIQINLKAFFSNLYFRLITNIN
jgi:ABC-type transport system involved in Fe-S cluster assembly fused permease/ATPase subunit